MATIQGTLGDCTIFGSADTTDFGAKLDMWTASLDSGTVQTTGFGDLGYRRHEPTIGRLSGSASGMCKTEFAPVPVLALGAEFLPSACKGTITLTATTGHTYSFTALVTDMVVTRPEDGKATVSFNFRSDGPVTQSAWT